MSKNRLYTFFFEYKDGTYIAQNKEKTVEKALKLWAKNLPITNIVGAKTSIKKNLFDEIEDTIENDGITPITGVKNVWCCTFLLSKNSVGILTITITEDS
jgi:hypothetical protein